MYNSYRKPNPIDLQLLKECGHPIGEWVWIRPNSSEWSGDWRNIKLMVVSVIWNATLTKWEFECIDENGTDCLQELNIDDVTKYNLWE
jgi:hypothetical protein